MKLFGLQYNLFTSVMVFNRPSPEVKAGYFLHGEAFLVEQVSQEHRDSSIRANQFDDSELDEFGPFSLPWIQSPEVIARGNDDEILLQAAANEGHYRRESGLCRAAEQEISVIVVPKVADELIAGISSIEEQYISRGNACQEFLSLPSLRSVDAFHAPGNREPSENIIRCGNPTMGEMTSTLVLEATLRIELSADLLGCRQCIDRTIEGVNRHSVP